jgi:putative transposase
MSCFLGKSTEEIVGPEGLLKQLTKAVLQKSRKRVRGDFGTIEVATPRDRNGSFEPKILPKRERRFAGFDQKILSMYARGMSTRVSARPAR